MTQAVDVVQTQVDAYNDHNYEAFRKSYSNDFEMRFFDGTLILRGQEQFDERYEDRFDKSKKQFVEILNRVSFGTYVIDHERIEGLNTNGSDHFTIVVYEVWRNKIQRVRIPPGIFTSALSSPNS